MWLDKCPGAFVDSLADAAIDVYLFTETFPGTPIAATMGEVEQALVDAVGSVKNELVYVQNRLQANAEKKASGNR